MSGATTMKKNLPAFALLVALLLLGCVEAPAPEDPEPPTCALSCPSPKGTPMYGFRLAPFYRTFDDGTKVLDPARLWDHERFEPCSFVRVDGGPARCLPAFEWNAHPGMFSDAGCTQPVAIFDACAELPRYVRDDLSKPYETCEPRPLAALYPLGDPLPVGAALFDMSSGSCETHTPVDALNVAMPLHDAVPLTEFVEGSEGP